MATGSSVSKRATRAGARKTASKLTRFAGGSDSAELLAAAKEIGSGNGITAGLASIAAADGQRFLEAPTSAIAPHPYNDPTRSTPQPENSRWTELVNSVRAAGVQVPILLVTRAAFVTARPNLADAIGNDARYVIIYGHRRRAAALAAGLGSIPAVIDDDVLADGGDLDAMTIENLGREDLTELQQAEMFARYSEAGLGQRAIADKLGVNQSTVSRRLSLLLLAPQVLAEVERGTIKSTEAAELAGKMPYGPPRPWQQETDTDQQSEERRVDQITACQMVLAGATPKRAAERALAQRRARRRAALEGIEIVDPQARFGPDFQRLVVASPAEAKGAVVAAIDSLQGGLIYFPATVPDSPAPGSALDTQGATNGESRQRAAAMKARRAACPRLVSNPPPREKLLTFLASHFAASLTTYAASPAGWKLAFEFSRSAGLTTADHPDVVSYRTAAAATPEFRRQLEVTWACVVAAFELHAADKNRPSWNGIDASYLALLADRGGYSPTAWEAARLSEAAQK